MLHILTGTDRLSLSEALLEQLCMEAERGLEGQILIVPEQFSHERERRLCQAGGSKISRYGEVLSFSRLADRVAAEFGGIARSYLDHGGRLLAMALAAEQISSRIKLFASMLRRPEFLVDMIAMVDEFQSYCLQPEAILEAAENAEGMLAQKLEEIGLLYEAYLAVCANGKADPAGKLLWLCDMLQDCPWPENKTIYVDGFSDFTGAELSVLEMLVQNSRGVTVALTVDEERPNVSGLATDTLRKLRSMAKQLNIGSDIRAVPPGCGRSPGVEWLLNHLFSVENTSMQSKDVCLRTFRSVEEECRHGVLHAKSLLEKGARCRDIAIACTDPGLYDAPLRAALEMAGLPSYFAGKEELLSKPLLSGILAALQAAVGPMDYEDVAVYLKSGLPELDRDACSRLDSYGYMWNLIGGQWERPWELHPRGFGEVWEEDDRIRLAVLEQDKQTALGPLFRLRMQLQEAKTTGGMVEALYAFLEEIHLRQRLEEQANILGGQMAQELLQIHDILCNSMEQTWMILQNTVRSPEDFSKLYRTVLSRYHVATIPAGIDQIYVGSIQDLRSKETKHLLVLGVTDGSFPSYHTGEGLLTEEDRKQLLASGVSLSPARADQMDREMSQIFGALSAAQDTIWMSCPGEQPAWLFRRGVSLFPDSFSQSGEDVFLDVPSFAAWRLRHGDQSEVSLDQLEQWEDSLRRLSSYQFEPLDRELVQGLYGRQIYLSASRIDKYAACRFAFFLAYGLKAQPRKQAKMDPSTFGTFVHEVLELTVKRVMAEGGFHTVSEQRLLAIAMEEIDRYAQAHFPQQAQRAAYLFHRSQEEILEIVKDLGEELRSSLFAPADCELEFSSGGQLPAVEILGKDASCKISGFVDRVDLYEKDGKTYVRVVDYKTGHKDFDYTDILNGAGLQMLIYLFALRACGGSRYQASSLIPAGVLYLPARTEYSLTGPAPDDDAVLLRHREERRRRGLISDDPAVLAAMEADPDHPRYMPYEVGKKGLQGDLASAGQMDLLERHVLQTLADMTDRIASGSVNPNPIFRGQDSSCRFCDYQMVCHMDLCQREVRSMANTPAKEFWERLTRKEDQAHG